MSEIPYWILWAVVVNGKRSRWINHATIRRTRKEAWAVYSEMWIEGAAEKQKRRGEVSLIRVKVEAWEGYS